MDPAIETPPSQATDGLPAALFRMLDAHQRAVAAAGETLHRFDLPGGRAEFAVSGDLLGDRLLDVLRHLDSREDRIVRLRAKLWDCAASGVRRPLPDIRRLFDGSEQFGDGVVARASGFRAYQSPRIYCLMDLAEGLLAACVTDAHHLAAFDIGKPLMPMLFPWYQHQGVQPMHAALVALEGQGVLIGGKGGSGKSTTALACARAGFDFLGDDYVGVSAEPRGYSFYGSAWLESEHSRSVAGLAGHRLPGIDAGERKNSFSVSRAFPGSLARSATIAALAIPRISNSEGSSIALLSSAEALLRFAPSSVLQTPFLEPVGPFRLFGELVRRLPCFELRIGRDRGAIAEGVRLILQTTGA